jgi:hypothetical protein
MDDQNDFIIYRDKKLLNWAAPLMRHHRSSFNTATHSSSSSLLSFINSASTTMPCYKPTVEYDGSRFSGFQRQTSNESSAATLAAAKNVKQNRGGYVTNANAHICES